MDAIVSNSGTNTIGIFLPKSDEIFEKQQIYSTGPEWRPCLVAAYNFNDDNYLDIAVANYGTNSINILLGYGNGTFINQTNYTTTPNFNPSFIAVANFNNDN